ncbi:MAG: hypothetical protein K2M98_07765, partial [Muribaculum sp.]|nr:hypothetical protein [Muribaculum sp.]
MRRLIITIAIAIAMVMPSMAVVNADSAAYRMELQRYLYPQEKIHVTTDQGRYVAGDTVWLRAFVVDAASHLPLTLSRYVYVELQNPMGDTELRIKLRHDSAGVFAGYLPLSDELPEGNYTMHAYTAFMENQGSGYYFRKSLPVMSPLSGRAVIRASVEPGSDRLTLFVADNSAPDVPVYFKEMILITSSGRQIFRGPAKKAETVSLRPEELRSGVVQVRFDNYARYIGLPGPVADSLSAGFYPEGGYLVAGEANRVGVKLLDSNGRGVNAGGTVYDSTGNAVTTFSTVHSGMGTLMFIPQEGEEYTAEVDGHRYALPAVNTDAAVVKAEVRGKDYIAVSTGGRVPEGSSIVAHNRGRLLYAGSAPHGDTPLL